MQLDCFWQGRRIQDYDLFQKLV